MAHDNTRPLRQFQSGAPGRATPQNAPPSQPQHNGDPLAELARLIGQSDPFADFGRKGAPEPPQAAVSAPAAREAPAPRDHHFLEPRLVEPEPADWRAPLPQEPVRLSPRPLQSIFPERYRDASAEGAEPEFDNPDVPPFDPAALRRGAGAVHGDVAPDNPETGAELPPEAEYGPEQAGEELDNPEDAYEEAPSRRRGGIIALLAVLALAVIGTAGAFGYRAMFGNSGPIGPPPVIRADQSPSKVVPAPQASESQSSKLIYDRVGDRSQGEKVVAREEQPLTITEPRPLPRSVFPSATPAMPGGFPPANSAATPVQPPPNPATASTEPKRVRTVVIRPDQPVGVPDAAANHPPPGAAPQRAASPPPAPVAPSRVASAPTPLPPPAPAAAAPEPAPAAREAVRPVSRPPAPAAPSANAPLSLAPPVNGAPPARVVSAPTNIRPPTSAIASGAYMVQVTSQRSEGEAHTAFRSLQAKFPRELGDRQAVVRRADLGARGIFYRAQVGPFASAAEAGEFCNGLKTAGGQCVVQRN